MSANDLIIRDLFYKDIARPIQGVVTIGNEDEEQKWQELEEYVCTDEIVKSFRTFFRRYRESIANPTEKIGVWITGFFGSGKSHFLKILGYILANEQVAGWEPARYFDDKIKDELVKADMKASAKAGNKVVLFNIDSKAKSDSKLKNQAIMDIMLRAFNESVGYCGTNPWVADMERALDTEGKLEEFSLKFEELSHRNWEETRAKAFLNRDYIIKALVAVRDMTEESARKYVDDQTRNYTNSTEEFAKIVNDYCRKNKRRVVFLMDEVGQFMSTDTQLMLNLQTCVEDLGKYCRGQAWVVVTSQQELKAMIESTQDKKQDFSKIQGRFDTRLLLSGADADMVIKDRILKKKEEMMLPLGTRYEAYASKLSNLILFPQKPTWSGYKDAKEFAEVYPFVSYQFELLQKVFEAIREHGMSDGKHLSQNERSLLSAFQNSAKAYADSNVGILVPFDNFYSTIEQFIDYDIKTVFSNAQRRASLGEFDIRVLRLLFMIKHVKEMPATIDRLATMMVSRLDEDKAALKTRILESLQRLEEETLIQRNGEFYDFLTNAEQDVNRQINNSGYNEAEVQRNIFDIIYDSILESSKYRYEGRYDFALNRYVDSELKGTFSQDGITMKFITPFTTTRSETDLGAESVRNNAIIIDLGEGDYISELIKANKIATFKRNNASTMSVALTEIMSKKSAELSERTKRAEDIIRDSLRRAPIYINGSTVDIKEKDGKDRLLDALKTMVKREYYKLGLVQYFYNDQRSILLKLNEGDSGLGDQWMDLDANKGAYAEILEKVKSDKQLGRTVTVKTLLTYFAKKPYGWRDLDILGMVGILWKNQAIQVYLHESLVDTRNAMFKNDLVHKNNPDTMVVRVKEQISEETLYKVKRIMNTVFAENYALTEDALKTGVIGFFEKKRQFLTRLKERYGSDYAGARAAREMFADFDAILRTTDSLTIFREIIGREERLEKNAETLEQMETFYREGSNQSKTFEKAKEIIDWYTANQMLGDLSSISDVVEQMSLIVAMELPFPKMSELANLVLKASEIQTRIAQEKYRQVKNAIAAARDTVSREFAEAQQRDLTDDQLDRLQEKYDSVIAQFDGWTATLREDTPNIDAYTGASARNVTGFQTFIETLLAEQRGTPVVRSKRVRVISCIPVANKRITSSDDVEKVVDAIRTKLLAELEENDELNLD